MPKDVVQERYNRLLELQERICEEENAKFVGRVVELLVQADGGRKNNKTRRLSGRARDGRLVHFTPVPTLGVTTMGDAMAVDGGIRPGDVVTVEVTSSAPHFLIADAGVLTHRRTVAGDMSSQGKTPTTAPIGVGLGLPKIGRPEPQPAAVAQGCCSSS